VIGLLGLGLLGIWAADASAHSAGYKLSPSGTLYHASSVRCQFEGLTPGSTGSVGLCEIATDEAILFCINPSDQTVTGTPRRLDIAFEEFFVFAQGTKTGGTTKYIMTADAAGVASSDEECDASFECTQLRQHCINPNWVPIDVVPVFMTATVSAFACPSKDACPCDPFGTDPTTPACVDHNLSTPEIDPEGSLTYQCQLGVPATEYEFGDLVQYTCSLVP
jgi:hypothetical protein